MDPHQHHALVTIRSQLEHIESAVKNIRDALIRVNIDEHWHKFQTHEDLNDIADTAEDMHLKMLAARHSINNILSTCDGTPPKG